MGRARVRRLDHRRAPFAPAARGPRSRCAADQRCSRVDLRRQSRRRADRRAQSHRRGGRAGSHPGSEWFAGSLRGRRVVRVATFATLRSLLRKQGDRVIDITAVKLAYVANVDTDRDGNPSSSSLRPQGRKARCRALLASDGHPSPKNRFAARLGARPAQGCTSGRYRSRSARRFTHRGW